MGLPGGLLARDFPFLHIQFAVGVGVKARDQGIVVALPLVEQVPGLVLLLLRRGGGMDRLEHPQNVQVIVVADDVFGIAVIAPQHVAQQ